MVVTASASIQITLTGNHEAGMSVW